MRKLIDIAYVVKLFFILKNSMLIKCYILSYEIACLKLEFHWSMSGDTPWKHLYNHSSISVLLYCSCDFSFSIKVSITGNFSFSGICLIACSLIPVEWIRNFTFQWACIFCLYACIAFFHQAPYVHLVLIFGLLYAFLRL